ncbi:MAG: hypothetical protein JO117_05690, partial [Verrucomicrobia bacterium]|nr:hypothetical protein [Verrucomicrobiota bacterium]
MFSLCLLRCALSHANAAVPISPTAMKVAQVLDSMDVEHRWLAHQRVHWRTGEPRETSASPQQQSADNEDDQPQRISTHCSAFVAAACERLGVYILRPPEHVQKLLANAQAEWLPGQGATAGWQPLADAEAAQDSANRGLLVVASYENRLATRPGHIAIVRPVDKTSAQLAAEGPDIIQAGGHNYARTSVRQG